MNENYDKLVIKSSSAAYEVLDAFYKHYKFNDLPHMGHKLDEFMFLYLNGPLMAVQDFLRYRSPPQQGFNWEGIFTSIGTRAIKEIVENDPRIRDQQELFNLDDDELKMPIVLGNFVELLWEKHQLYGPRPIRIWGELGLSMQLHSKAERVISMTKGEKLQPNKTESLMDTYYDILGYSIIGYLYTTEVK